MVCPRNAVSSSCTVNRRITSTGGALSIQPGGETRTTLTSLFLAALLLVGCGGAPGSQEDPEGEIGIAPSDLVSVNALNMNALNMSAIDTNALSMNALSPTNFAAMQAPTTSGALARQLFKYAVSCALEPSQSSSLTWTDEWSVVHQDTYRGLLGLAPGWETRPLISSEQAWVSACLIARVNWYGVSVTISARGATSGLNVTDPGELLTYAHEEGAFWGNLFGESPHAYSCSNVLQDGFSRSRLRDCAAGHLTSQATVDCGMFLRLGSCNGTCIPFTNSGGYHPGCRDETGSSAKLSTAVVTIFLQ